MPARKRFSLFGTLTVALAGALMIAVAVPATAGAQAGAVESTAGSTTVTDESGPFATTTYLSLDSDRIQVGELATMFIEVEGQDPTGDVTVTEGATVLGQATLDNGMTDLSIDGLRAGSHTLTATYGGDAANDPSTSETVNLTVIKWSSELSLDLPPTAAVGSTVTATVLVSGGDHPGTGTVRLTRAGTQIASGALKSGQAVLSFPAGINAGSSWITASFDGDDVMGRSQESMQLTVVPAASTTTVTFAPASGVKAGTRLVATVTVKAAGTVPTGVVSLATPGLPTHSAQLSGGKAVVDLGTSLAAGTHVVTVSYGGSASTKPSTGRAGVTIGRLGAVMTVSTSTAGYGSSAKIAVAISGAPVVPTGTVRAYLGSSVVASAKVVSGRATLTLPAPWTPASRAVAVRYDGGPNHLAASKSLIVTIVRAKATATASLPPVAYGTGAKVRVTVRGAGSVPSGIVRVYRGSALIGTGTLASGVVSIALPRLNPGRYALTVKYAGSSRHLPVVVPVTQVVTKAAPSVTASVSGSLIPSVTHRLVIKVQKSLPAPSGKVIVLRGGKTVGSATLSATGAATVTLPWLAVGSTSFTVKYSGDSRYSPGTAVVSAQITKARSFGNGTFRVGVDIPAGLYRVKVPAGSLCYWARLKDASGSLSSILANQLENGYGLIEVLSTDRYVESSDCGTWKLVSDTANWPFRGKDLPGDGAFLVNKDISPGTYYQVWSGCYVELLSRATGGLSAIIDNDYSSGGSYAIVSSSVFAVRVSGCSTWYRG